MSRTIDVIIPVYKPDQDLKKLLIRLKDQSLRIHQIILMHTEDGQNLDWVYEIAENIIVKSVSPLEFDHGGTRHEGVLLTKADVFVCMTQDCIPVDERLIEELTAKIGKNGVSAAYARQLPKKDCDLLEAYTRNFNYPSKGSVKSQEDLSRLGIKTYFCSNVCAAYSREIYEELGGFERHTIFNEDMIFAAKMIKAGYKISYEANARVLHSHNYSNLQQLKRNFDMAVSQAEHPEIFASVKSETEGMRMVKQTAMYVIKNRKPWYLVSLVTKSGAKYLGYKLGLHYKKLPFWMITRLTMNRRYW